MNISETIKALPPGAIHVLVAGDTKGSIRFNLELTVVGLQRLVNVLERCETAIDSLSTGSLGFGSNDKTWWALRDELLSDIREALGK